MPRSKSERFVVVSDHNTTSQHALAEAHQRNVAAGPLLIRGNEVKTCGGHGNALGVAGPIDHRVGLDGRTLEDVVADVSSADGLFVINHPTLDLGNACIGCAWSLVESPWGSGRRDRNPHRSVFGFADLIGRPARQMGRGARPRCARDRGRRLRRSPRWRRPLVNAKSDRQSDDVGLCRRAVRIRDSGLHRCGPSCCLAVGPGRSTSRTRSHPAATRQSQLATRLRRTKFTISARILGGRDSAARLIENGGDGEVRFVDSENATAVWLRDVPETGARYRIEVSVAGQVTTVTNHIYAEYEAPSDSGFGCQARGPNGAGSSIGLLIALGAMLLLTRRRTRGFLASRTV